MKKSIQFFSVFCFLIFIISCSDLIEESAPTVFENESSTNVRALFSEIQDSVFTGSCASSACHGGLIAPDLSPGSAYNNIINVPSLPGSGGDDYIEPGDPDKSYLFRKITGENITGGRMPKGLPPLENAVIDSIRQWILNGAQNN